MFYLCYRVILFFTVFIIIDGARHTVEQDDEIQKHCGQYGFRCLDKETVEFCDDKDLDGNRDVAQTFVCSANLTCNEDSSSYCSPDIGYDKRGIHTHLEKIDLMKVDTNGDIAGFIIHDVESLDLRNGLYDDDEESETTTSFSYTQEDDFESATKEEEPSFKEEAINCLYFGFYPDPENQNQFYFCDLPKNGKGFNLRHMNCGKGRIFDKIFRECILIGTTRNVRNEEDNNTGHTLIYDDKGDFNCTGKKAGKYGDSNNCHIYYLCLPADLFSPFAKLTIKCPKRSAYDPVQHVCNKRAISRCTPKSNDEDQINCRNQMRFRETRTCDHYFLCYQDQVIKLHCPDYQQFDDKELQCLPQHLVECN